MNSATKPRASCQTSTRAALRARASPSRRTVRDLAPSSTSSQGDEVYLGESQKSPRKARRCDGTARHINRSGSELSGPFGGRGGEVETLLGNIKLLGSGLSKVIRGLVHDVECMFFVANCALTEDWHPWHVVPSVCGPRLQQHDCTIGHFPDLTAV